jgi:DNA gyrase/topoisomerase IV subunit B
MAADPSGRKSAERKPVVYVMLKEVIDDAVDEFIIGHGTPR